MIDIPRKRMIAPVMAVFGLSVGLSGCIAALPLLAVGSLAASGFMAYKVVQTADGGSVEIQFASKDGKTIPAQPLTPPRRVAIWPGDEGDVHFAERLQASGKFSAVTAPAAVSAILAETKTPSNLSQLTQQEQNTAFDQVCGRTRADILFASRPLGATTDSNVFSFSRANITFRADLLGYSCVQHRIVWRDQIQLVMTVGSSTSSTSEMNRAGGDG